MRNGNRNYVGSRLGRALNTIKSGHFGGNTESFKNLINNLTNGGD